jgi:malto-oligosyltrehalose synthase
MNLVRANRIPVGTYRVQFNKYFRFRDAINLVIPYLEGLGITDLYASPIMKARTGSLHGYDVTDPSVLNPELGTKEDFEELVRELQARNIGVLLDIVPNHMAASSENPWWTHVLENGSSSPYATFFDINWEPTRTEPKHVDSLMVSQDERIFLPILGASYGTVLENQELELIHERDGFFIRYYAAKLPVDPWSYPMILRPGFDEWANRVGVESPAAQELCILLEAFERLPHRASTDWEMLEARSRDLADLKRRLWELRETYPEIAAYIQSRLEFYRGTKGDPRSFDPLDRLLSEQPYILAYWRVAREKINYRRFFDVSELIGLRAEDPQVHQATHELIYELVRSGKVTGLRIDHVDGLYDPAEYLSRIQENVPGTYVVVEKILQSDEVLPASWPVAGTTGYDFLGVLNNVFVRPQGLRDLEKLYTRLTGVNVPFEEIVYRQKKRIIEQLFAGEMLAMGLHLGLLAEQDRHARDLSPQELRQALMEITACLPVYRTYIRTFEVSDHDRKYLARAFAEARGRNPDITPEVFDFVESILMLRFSLYATDEMKERALRFVMRWQQLTGPVMAKGLEDTSLYVYNRLVSLNDVGGRQQAVSPQQFHEFNMNRAHCWPATLNATSTHDTKRSEDVRARINVLSEMPAEWTRRVLKWRRWNRVHKKECGGTISPDANDEILIYQTLIGAYPLDPAEMATFRDRVCGYIIKAAREAKVLTSWLSPDHEYERCLVDFVTALLEESPENQFLADFLTIQKRVAYYGAINSLSQVLLKIVSPGIPDFYQGSVLWDFSLVDPDNRRPVDFVRRMNLLEEMQSWKDENLSQLVQSLWDNWQDGGIKLYVTYKAMRFRHDHRELFLHGNYLPIVPEGMRREHVLSFAREYQGQWVIAVAPRLVSRLSSTERLPVGRQIWRDTLLPLPPGAPARWMNVLTGEKIVALAGRALEMHSVFQRFPGALLTPL